MDELLQEMIDPEPPRRDAARRRRLWTTIAVLGLAGVGITSLTTSALFTDTQTVAGDLVTGTVDISSTNLSLTMPTGGLAPGGTVAKAVTVSNAGSLALRYSVSYAADKTAPITGTVGLGDLRTQLTLSVFGVPDAASCATTTTTPAASLTSATVTDLSKTDTTTPTYVPILGRLATPDPTDSAHKLDATVGSDVLCVKLSMASSADNSYQNTSAKVTLKFDAEQTVNNA